MRLINSTTATVAGAGASAGALYGIGHTLAVIPQAVMTAIPAADTLFGLAVTGAALTAAAVAGPLARAARWFVSTSPAEGAPTPYRLGTWGNSRVAEPKGETAQENVETPTTSSTPVPLSVGEARVDADLRIILDTVKNHGKFFEMVQEWLEQKKVISDADFYHILDHMPRGSNWGWDSGGADFFSDMADTLKIRVYNTNDRYLSDMHILYLATSKIGKFYYPAHVSEIYERIKRFLPTMQRYSTYHDGFKANVLRYYYHKTERLKQKASGYSGDGAPPQPVVPVSEAKPPVDPAPIAAGTVVAIAPVVENSASGDTTPPPDVVAYDQAVKHLDELATDDTEARRSYAKQFLETHGTDLSAREFLTIVDRGYFAEAKNYDNSDDKELFAGQWKRAVISAKKREFSFPIAPAYHSVIPADSVDSLYAALDTKLARLDVNTILFLRDDLSEAFADEMTFAAFRSLHLRHELSADVLVKLVNALKNTTFKSRMIMEFSEGSFPEAPHAASIKVILGSPLTPLQVAHLIMDLRNGNSDALLNHLTLNLIAKNGIDLSPEIAAKLIGDLQSDDFESDDDDWEIFVKHCCKLYLGKHDGWISAHELEKFATADSASDIDGFTAWFVGAYLDQHLVNLTAEDLIAIKEKFDEVAITERIDRRLRAMQGRT